MKSRKRRSLFDYTVVVKGQEYGHPGWRFNKIYLGNNLVELLVRIAKAHRYGALAAMVGSPTLDELVNEIKDRSGDGCDVITKLSVNGNILISGRRSG